MASTIETGNDHSIHLSNQLVDRSDYLDTQRFHVLGVLRYARMAAFDIGTSARKCNDYFLLGKQSLCGRIVPLFCKGRCMGRIQSDHADTESTVFLSKRG